MPCTATKEREKPLLIFVPQRFKINKEGYIEDIFEGALLTRHNTLLEYNSIGVERTVRLGSAKKNCLLYHLILTFWTILCGQSWRVKHALLLAKY